MRPCAPRPEVLPRRLPIPRPIRFCGRFWPSGALRSLKFIARYPSPYLSTIASRCGTLATIPRNDGVSGRSTTWLIFLRPRLRTITLCFSGVQIGLLTSLILIVLGHVTTLPY